MTPELSQELVDQVIDCLGDTYHAQSEANKRYVWQPRLSEPWRDSLRDLCSASLICHAFRPRVQFHIFSVIRLFLRASGPHAQDETSTRHHERMQGLLNALQTRRNLAGAHIYLSITHDLSNAQGYDPTEDVDMINLVRYIRTSAMRVTTLNLSTIDPGEFTARDVHTKFIDHFLDMSHVTRLELRGLGLVPRSLFALCPRLTDLVVDSAKIDWTGTDTRHFKALQLRQLTIEQRCDSGWLARFLGIDPDDYHVLDLTKLDRLTIRAQDIFTNESLSWLQNEEARCNTNLTKLCGATLGNLYVNLGKVRDTAVSSLPLMGFMNLHIFGVRVDWVFASIEHVCGWLSQLPPSPVLSEVNFHIIIHTSVPKVLSNNWALLDQTISDLFRGSQSTSKTVSICFYTFRLTDFNLSMIPAEYLGMETWDRSTLRDDPILHAAVKERVSHYLFKVSIAPKFLKLFGSTDIRFRVTLGGEIPYWEDER